VEKNLAGQLPIDHFITHSFKGVASTLDAIKAGVKLYYFALYSQPVSNCITSLYILWGWRSQYEAYLCQIRNIMSAPTSHLRFFVVSNLLTNLVGCWAYPIIQALHEGTCLRAVVEY
jgi:hypothetical protein